MWAGVNDGKSSFRMVQSRDTEGLQEQQQSLQSSHRTSSVPPVLDSVPPTAASHLDAKGFDRY